MALSKLNDHHTTECHYISFWWSFELCDNKDEMKSVDKNNASGVQKFISAASLYSLLQRTLLDSGRHVVGHFIVK